MTYRSRLNLIALVGLSLAACTPDAPMGSSDDGGARSDVPVADAPGTDVPSADVPILDAPVTDAPFADAPVADRAPVCEPALATLDCGTEAIAQTICGIVRDLGRACHVCVQNVDSAGRATGWMAIETPESCGCPTPALDPRSTRASRQLSE